MVRGQCAYTAQSAWIRNVSLRDNILMGRPLYQARYDAVIKACALEQDLRALPAGKVAASLDPHTLCQNAAPTQTYGVRSRYQPQLMNRHQD